MRTNPAYTHLPHQWPYGSTIWSRLWDRLNGKRERWLAGPIYVGEWFIWEPDVPGAGDRIVVTEVEYDGEDWFLRVRVIDAGLTFLIDSHRFREACIRAWEPRKIPS